MSINKSRLSVNWKKKKKYIERKLKKLSDCGFTVQLVVPPPSGLLQISVDKSGKQCWISNTSENVFGVGNAS